MNTEYSSAKCGVQPPASVSEPCPGLGVSKTGLGKVSETGVSAEVGGRWFELAKLYKPGLVSEFNTDAMLMIDRLMRRGRIGQCCELSLP